ncbi:MAG: NADH-quinone oxidoreductase subunit C [Methanobacteriota archaeon]
MSDLVAAFRSRAGGLVVAEGKQLDKPSLTVRPDALGDALRVAHEVGFDHLACLTGVDYLPGTPVEIKSGPDAGKVPKEDGRIEVVYNLYSLSARQHLVVRVKLPRENPEVESATGVWKGADWLEREIIDLYGVKFRHHPDPRRLFMPEDWTGHPLRKDYDGTKEQFINTADGKDVVSFTPGSGW